MKLLPLSNRRRHMIAVAAALCAGPLLHTTVHAQDQWPSKPIRLIVPFTPGGVTDTSGRLIAENLGKRLGQQVVVDNKPGASGNIAADTVAKAAGDGYLFVFLEIGFQSGGSGGHVKSCAVGVNSQLTDFGELVAAHGNKFGFRRIRMCLLLFGHSAGILKACLRFG